MATMQIASNESSNGMTIATAILSGKPLDFDWHTATTRNGSCDNFLAPNEQPWIKGSPWEGGKPWMKPTACAVSCTLDATLHVFDVFSQWADERKTNFLPLYNWIRIIARFDADTSKTRCHQVFDVLQGSCRNSSNDMVSEDPSIDPKTMVYDELRFG